MLWFGNRNLLTTKQAVGRFQLQEFPCDTSREALGHFSSVSIFNVMMCFYAILIQCPSSSISVVALLGIYLAGFSCFFQNRGAPTAQSHLLTFFTYKWAFEGRCYVYVFMDYCVRIISQNLLFLMEGNCLWTEGMHAFPYFPATFIYISSLPQFTVHLCSLLHWKGKF